MSKNKNIESLTSDNNETENVNQQQQIALETQQFAHDLRTPIMVLKNALKKSSAPDPLIQKSVERLVEISENYLKSKRKQILEQEYVSNSQHHTIGDFKKIVKQTLSVVPELSAEMNKTCQVSFYNFVALQSLLQKQFAQFVRFDAIEMRTIIENVIKNSIEAIGKDQIGEMRCTLYTENDTLCLELQDNGKGICPNILKKLQDSESLSHQKSNGTGFGLSGARRFLKKWNSSIEINSNLGTGTSLTIRLPLLKNIPTNKLN